MTSTISNLVLVKDKDAYSADENVKINVKFSLTGDLRNQFNEKNWTESYVKNDNQFKLKYGIKLVTGGIRKHNPGREIDTYRKASIFWTRNPKLVNPMKEKRIWVQVAKNFEPFIRLTEEEVQQELFDFDEQSCSVRLNWEKGFIKSAHLFLLLGIHMHGFREIMRKFILKKLKLTLINDARFLNNYGKI